MRTLCAAIAPMRAGLSVVGNLGPVTMHNDTSTAPSGLRFEYFTVANTVANLEQL